MKAFSILETGSRRKNNEDALLALTNIGLFAVADGMGGHNAGEVASGIAIESLKNNAEKLKDIPVDGIEQWVLDTVKEANQAIFERSLYEEGVEGMGTTLTALVIKKIKRLSVMSATAGYTFGGTGPFLCFLKTIPWSMNCSEWGSYPKKTRGTIRREIISHGPWA